MFHPLEKADVFDRLPQLVDRYFPALFCERGAADFDNDGLFAHNFNTSYPLSQKNPFDP